MSDNRWQRIEDVFRQAAGLAPEARPAFLSEVCAGDESLRKEVETLLAHDAGDGPNRRVSTFHHTTWP